MNQDPNRMWTPGASRKRKDRDTFYKPSVISTAPEASPNHKTGGEALWSNRLLAGYMAHEFLTKGTLLGHKFDSAGGETEDPSYAEVASLLKTDGAHIPEIVNPTQLVRWIKM